MRPARSLLLGLSVLFATTAAAPAFAQGTAPAGGPAVPDGQAATAAPALAGIARLVDPRNPLIRGEALLQQTAPGITAVVVTVYGLEPGSTHINHVHGQSCAGPIRFPLSDLVADASGTARAVSTVPGPMNPEDWYVNVHAWYALPSPGITCGKVAAVPPPAPPPAAPPASAPSSAPATP